MGVRDLVKRLLMRDLDTERLPKLSVSSWGQLARESGGVVQVCHPDWRGVRTVAYSFHTPVIECDDLAYWSEHLSRHLSESGIEVVVIQGWPPGSGDFARALVKSGIQVKCVLHSSPAQHGAEKGEAAVADEVLDMVGQGTLSELGMAKRGVSEALRAIGYPVTYVPNRVPSLPEMTRRDLGPGSLHVGVFAEPFWRKNVVTQLLAVGLIEGAVAHVMRKPDVRYLDGLEIVEHGELPWEEFVVLQGSVDLNLYVTLSECHPSTPQESYIAGVPCLISRVSGVFRDIDRLWDITSTDSLDDPSEIALAAMRLVSLRAEAVELAGQWMNSHDARAQAIWSSFSQPRAT